MTSAPISGVRKIQQDKKAMAHESAEGLKRDECLSLLACSSEQRKGRVPQPSPRSHNGCSTHEQPQALFCILTNIVVADSTNVYPNKRFQTQRTRTKRSTKKVCRTTRGKKQPKLGNGFPRQLFGLYSFNKAIPINNVCIKETTKARQCSP